MSKAADSMLRGAREALAYAQGERDGFVAHVPEQVDVKAVRDFPCSLFQRIVGDRFIWIHS